MRTTVILNDELLREAKKRAADEGTSFKALLEKALRAYLGSGAPARPYRFRWRTTKGRILPGVDLEDRDSLFDIMDGLK